MYTLDFVSQHLAEIRMAFSLFHPLIFQNPCCEFRRFTTADVQLFDELFNTVRSGVSFPVAPVSVVQPVWCNDFYYNEYPGYARLRDVLPLLHARFLWWAESGDDIYHPSASVSNFYPELTYADIQIRLEHRQVRLAVLNHLSDSAEED
ncbi:uncharacterized protein LOC123476914 [Daphnia magna]|uniref:uncharacterized protein LOC123468087 n=1 Tax=Daphnia magna TaxID=35525 RepID=UPI001E1BBDC7|nr:uncharacterized protein LOC123468087 [Daphnia magna]XP_045023856.1 uncharacterized protein LOC123468645 [Daphnia magna]XP_045035033.1 uncharacterized protein LOC123475893 [Daphnia magna]XP_045035062.1 uncharacterized protein LOC123475906 [Daphnia magna]XP_045035845.1 uncharacterized protein LOC123476914 [Daphnia magna]